MSNQTVNEDYLLESDEEPLRLERQALIYGFEDDLTVLSLSSNERVLDAGWGIRLFICIDLRVEINERS